MTALSDIVADLKRQREDPARARPHGSATRRFKIVVGDSAERSICCETDNHTLPLIIDGAPVERTRAFRGWQVVEL